MCCAARDGLLHTGQFALEQRQQLVTDFIATKTNIRIRFVDNVTDRILLCKRFNVSTCDFQQRPAQRNTLTEQRMLGLQ